MRWKRKRLIYRVQHTVNKGGGHAALINLTSRHTYQATSPMHISHSEDGNCNLTTLTPGVAKHQKSKFIFHLGLKEYKNDKI